jgi:hypothetical protein
MEKCIKILLWEITATVLSSGKCFRSWNGTNPCPRSHAHTPNNTNTLSTQTNTHTHTEYVFGSLLPSFMGRKVEKQQMLYTYNAILGRFRENLLPFVSSKYLMPWFCVCNLIHSARKVYAPYCIVIRDLDGSTTFFPHYHINDAIFGKKKVFKHKMCVLIFSTTYVWKFFRSRKIPERYFRICSNFCQISMKLAIFSIDFLNISNTKFHENPSNESWGFSCRRTNGQTDRQKWW